jgi:hypothetical protein
MFVLELNLVTHCTEKLYFVKMTNIGSSASWPRWQPYVCHIDECVLINIMNNYSGSLQPSWFANCYLLFNHIFHLQTTRCLLKPIVHTPTRGHRQRPMHDIASTRYRRNLRRRLIGWSPATRVAGELLKIARRRANLSRCDNGRCCMNYRNVRDWILYSA